MWLGPDGRRYFPGDTCDHGGGHEPGDRHDYGTHVDEWDGRTWAPVCPTDDVAMRAHDGAGWLCCLVCGMRAVDVDRSAVAS